jgi:hypothetical protein
MTERRCFDWVAACRMQRLPALQPRSGPRGLYPEDWETDVNNDRWELLDEKQQNRVDDPHL